MGDLKVNNILMPVDNAVFIIYKFACSQRDFFIFIFVYG